MDAKTFASEYDVNSGRINRINVMQNYIGWTPLNGSVSGKVGENQSTK